MIPDDTLSRGNLFNARAMTVNVRTMSVRAGTAGVAALLVFFCVISGCVNESAPQTGTLSFTTLPEGAEVYLDNQYRGTTPSTLEGVAPGQHTLTFRSTGHESYSETITVPAGPSNYYAALHPVSPSGPATVETPSEVVVVPVARVNVSVSKERMVVGESNVFSGTASGTDTVLLTVYGPGKYTNGVALVRQNVNNWGQYSTTWSPGTSLLAGTYTIVAEDAWKSTMSRMDFTVIGGGIVSIAPSTYAAAPGQTVTFSGQCTTGAQNIRLVLFGPGQFSSGIDYPMLPVDASQTWNFKYKLDSTMPTGQYTMYVYDNPKTASSSTQFTVGYTG